MPGIGTSGALGNAGVGGPSLPGGPERAVGVKCAGLERLEWMIDLGRASCEWACTSGATAKVRSSK